MAAGPGAVPPVPALGGTQGTSGLLSGSAAAIESVLRGRLQGPGHSGAPGITNLATSLPKAHWIAVVCRIPRRDTLPGLLRLLSVRRLRLALRQGAPCFFTWPYM